LGRHIKATKSHRLKETSIKTTDVNAIDISIGESLSLLVKVVLV